MSTEPTAEQKKEYDRFGPWITEISEEDPVPSIFVPYLEQSKRALFSFKIPRRIERRQASPGMDLYDHLVTVYEDLLVVLSRDGHNVNTERCAYGEIQMIHYIQDLLDGHLVLVFPHGAADLPFNSVSTEAVEKLIEQIRMRYALRSRTVDSGDVDRQATLGLSFHFQNDLKNFLAAFPQFRLKAAQAETSIKHAENRGWRRLVFGIIGRHMTESMHFTDGRELVVAHHGRQYRYFRRPLYTQHRTYLPCERVTRVTWEDDPDNSAVVHLTVGTEMGSFSAAFTRDNPSREPYAVYLSKLLQPGSES